MNVVVCTAMYAKYRFEFCKKNLRYAIKNMWQAGYVWISISKTVLMLFTMASITLFSCMIRMKWHHSPIYCSQTLRIVQ